MRDKRGGLGRRLVLLGGLLLAAGPGAAAQPPPYAAILQNVPLEEALPRLAESARISLAYDAELARGHTVHCVLETAEVEALLGCVLAGTGLDFVRTSSGTYVIVEATRQAPAFGRLAGAVVDGASGEPLPYAHVLLAEAGLGAAANEGGLFSLAALEPGGYRVTLSYIGYRTRVDTVWIAPGATTEAAFALEPHALTAPPVLITGLEHRMPSRLLGRLEASGAEALAGPAWAEAPAEPIGLARHGPWADLHLQGGGSGEQLLLLDGMPIRNAVALGRLVSAFSPLALERATVHKAGFGARHGSALSGRIELEHALHRAGQHAAAQLGPLGLSLRAQHRLSLPGGAMLDVMAAGRSSLWSLMRDPALERMLAGWNVIDPYLSPVHYVTTSEREASPHETAVDLHDLHGAARLRWGPFHALSASFYRGHGAVEARQAFVSETLLSAPFSRDRYAAETTGGRLRYHGFLGPGLLASLALHHVEQAFGHGYTMPYAVRDSADLPPDPLALRAFDQNELAETAAEAQLEAQIGRRHQLAAALALTRVESHLRIDNDFFREAAYDGAHWRISGSLQDDIRLGPRTQLEIGLRYAVIAGHYETYAEPRIGLRYDGHSRRLGDYALRLAGGLYRQYVHELDLSSSGPMGILPFVRFWMPAGPEVGPSLAYHLAGDALWQPSRTLRLELEAYAKWQPRRAVIDYEALAVLHQPDDSPLFGEALVTAAAGRALGLEARVRYRRGRLDLALAHGLMHATQRIPDRFGGRAQPLPWEQPHRLTARANVELGAGLAAFSRWQGIWGRSWAYRRAYYDYLEPLVKRDLAYLIPVDVTDPGADALSAFRQWDAGLALTSHVGPARLLAEVRILNILGRRNELDRMAVDTGEDTVIQSRLYPGRSLSLSLRLEI